MKTLSIRQPWAWLITYGIKNVENRSWNTNYRGPLLIHASKFKPDPGLVAELKKTLANISYPFVTVIPDADKLEIGGIVGKATLVDCVQHSSSRWFTGPYGFVLQDAKILPFRSMPGRLGFFDL